MDAFSRIHLGTTHCNTFLSICTFLLLQINLPSYLQIYIMLAEYCLKKFIAINIQINSYRLQTFIILFT